MISRMSRADGSLRGWDLRTSYFGARSGVRENRASLSFPSLALNCGVRSGSLNAEVNAFEVAGRCVAATRPMLARSTDRIRAGKVFRRFAPASKE